jgi:hypothetical protein
MVHEWLPVKEFLTVFGTSRKPSWKAEKIPGKKKPISSPGIGKGSFIYSADSVPFIREFSCLEIFQRMYNFATARTPTAPMISHAIWSADPAQDGRPDPDDDRVFIHEHGEERTGEDHKGNAQGQAEEEEKEISLGCPGHGKDVVRTHDEVGDHNDPDCLPESRRLFLKFVLRHAFDEEFYGDPKDYQPSNQFNEDHLQELGHEEGDDHPQGHRRPGSENDPAPPLLSMEVFDRQGDDHRIVSRQDQVDEHDAEKPQAEFPAELDPAQPPYINSGSGPSRGPVRQPSENRQSRKPKTESPGSSHFRRDPLSPCLNKRWFQSSE